MLDKDDKKREAPISYRPPKDLREAFYERVEKSGLSTGAFITKAIFNHEPPRQSRRPPVEKEMLARLLGGAAKIRDELHEISLTTGEGDPDSLLIEAACDQLTEIRAAILKLAARKP